MTPEQLNGWKPSELANGIVSVAQQALDLVIRLEAISPAPNPHGQHPSFAPYIDELDALLSRVDDARTRLTAARNMLAERLL